MKKIISVVGTRPNFIKMQSVVKELSKKSRFRSFFVHAGQHYDYEMSKIFFEDLDLPVPDFFLQPKRTNTVVQICSMMEEFDRIIESVEPDLVVVTGDVNSSLACALVAGKRHIPLAHIESGLRSFDKKMPEEINRILIDKLSQLLFVTEKSALENLSNEGFDSNKIHFVGNTMIDSLVMLMPKIKNKKAHENYALMPNNYGVVTFHRPSNVDDEKKLHDLIKELNFLSKSIHLIFPVHPRTNEKINSLGLSLSDKIIATKPLSYIEFMSLVSDSKFVITDSGGIQEETTYLGIQCYTLRDNTERPITIDIGSNTLVGSISKKAFRKINSLINENSKSSLIPQKWDGKSSKNVISIIEKFLVQ